MKSHPSAPENRGWREPGPFDFFINLFRKEKLPQGNFTRESHPQYYSEMFDDLLLHEDAADSRMIQCWVISEKTKGIGVDRYQSYNQAQRGRKW